MNILVTGSAGFIGRSLCYELLSWGHTVHGVDNLNDDFGQAKLKRDRTETLMAFDNFMFYHKDLTDPTTLEIIFDLNEPYDVVYHLAAQPGVKQSSEHPRLFTDSNLVAFFNVLEICRMYHIPHLIFASSSSVYGDAYFPSTENDRTDNPKSYYAATKKANEVMASSYSNMYKLKITGVRLFTVYGPWGRPDMATWKFTEAILKNNPIVVYSSPRLIYRDFTYIDDVVKCLHLLTGPRNNKGFNERLSLFQLYNIGGTNPIKLTDYISSIEKILDKPAIRTTSPLSESEASHTSSNMSKFKRHYDYEAQHTKLEIGLNNFVEWFKKYQCTDS